MENENQEDIEETVLPSDTDQEIEETVDTDESIEQDPLKTELEKVQRKGRTRAEKLLYTRNRIDQQLKDEGIDIDETPEADDDQPVTMGMLKKLQAQTATKTALQLADDVTNETERELLKYHIDNTIKSTGNPQQDFELARTLVNAVKNTQIMEQANLKPVAKTHASSSGAPAKIEKQPSFTTEELSFMKPPFNLTKEQIIAARPQ